jgi:hypothetical protein
MPSVHPHAIPDHPLAAISVYVMRALHQFLVFSFLYLRRLPMEKHYEVVGTSVKCMLLFFVYQNLDIV